ncbi:hypothetical protein QFC21_002197 [Naganishia friedmannii]|uniref:Uncharacterized protein n=1 Tax=Naganishia friedmannii TaxID=89922 RepID=A0ACC2VXZ5_9TREE|nr:hypothetical protein QFC21_002197 [Naganishia friedmannii]
MAPVLPDPSALVKRTPETNYTMDDTSATIYYIDFPAVEISKACSSTPCAYGNTLHQTSSSSASAAFPVTGSAVYIYGIRSPSAGPFTVTIDGITYSQLTGYCETSTPHSLLFEKTGLDPAQKHQIVMRNAGPSLMSLDYIIGTSGGAAIVQPPDGQKVSPLPTGSTPASSGSTGSSSTDIFGIPTSMGGAAAAEDDKGDNNTGAIIGGVAGVILFLVIAFMVFRKPKKSKADKQYRKRGGKGTFWEALFGENRRKREKDANKNAKAEWHNWPMLRYVPTYSTKDLAEENDKREREEKEKKSRSSSK